MPTETRIEAKRDSGSSAALADTANLSLLGNLLGSDVEASIDEALTAGAVFPAASKPLAVFREVLATSIRDIEHHKRGQLLQRFLLQGPYENTGEIPPEMALNRLPDDDVAAATAFIYSFMVNSFKGSLVELLALAPCVRLTRKLQEEKRFPENARLFVGDTVQTASSGKSRFVKGADLHILAIERTEHSAGAIYFSYRKPVLSSGATPNPEPRFWSTKARQWSPSIRIRFS